MKKILILSANPINTTQLRLNTEVREIQSALERSRNREEFELIPRLAVRIDDLRRALLDYSPQIVHFSGHGDGTNGIALEDNNGYTQLVGTESLSNFFKLSQETVECVLLNACYSKTQAEAIYQHINCVVGMERAITDEAAIHFSKAFYDALGAGRNYNEAFEFGCNNIDLNSRSECFIPKIQIRNESKTLFPLKSREPRANMTGGNNDNKRIQGGYIQGNFSGTYNNSGNYIEGNYNASGEEKNLAESAAEIQKLLEQLSKSYSTDTFAGKVQIANETIIAVENNPTLAARILSALKTGGVSAFEQFLNHPAASFVMGALDDWQKTKGQQPRSKDTGLLAKV
ncbi:hypothetical protein DP113_27170 [Brasilonema octagenarum UFV-E1]|uniref:CHAT domain-containing protein n=1 Tax=Brasilonema sennae CENA114 TaxID=415709 RepID=A0A856MK83_9CYAN|nr:CHAT domain-containing protein [Brasilonema sennae]QDL11098.1 hypothetical protein DP114_27240 [Brasilonema sennae CENA114]QDL17443.1 hypothetical protein DP113_27170 [Brasilonema octagenarum UFV-E1]